MPAAAIVRILACAKDSWGADTIRYLSARRPRVRRSSAQPRRDRAGSGLVQSVPANFTIRGLKPAGDRHFLWKCRTGHVAFFLPVYVASRSSSPKTVRTFYFYLWLRNVVSKHGLGECPTRQRRSLCPTG